MKAGLAFHFKWTLEVIGGMYWDDAVSYTAEAERLQKNHYGWLLDIAACAQSNDGYKSLRRTLAGKDQAKLLVPKTEAEVAAALKGETDGV